MIRDLIPSISKLYFLKTLSEETRLSREQAGLLLGLGLQFKEINPVIKELDIPVNQGLALLAKSVKRISKCIRTIYEKVHKDEMNQKILSMVRISLFWELFFRL